MSPLPYYRDDFTSGESINNPSSLFNYTQVKAVFGDKYNLAPRMQRCSQDVTFNDTRYTTQLCIMTLDTEYEKSIGLGPNYPLEPLGPGECVLGSAWKGFNGTQIGTNITINMNLKRTEEVWGYQVYNPIAQAQNWHKVPH